MFRFDNVARSPLPSPKITAAEKMAEIVKSCRDAEESALFGSPSDVKAFYLAARTLGLAGHSRKKSDGSGWECWVENERKSDGREY